ncbi:Ig-like domain-containing protein [Polaribacter cellanae]|uniref:Ig-like domain-containing protein n=1 Tax=Polaribacter cellanae TaxID=2818493 RepID=A0A975CRW7_9FLAO|nr:Ig-like domain-containing protein [Polaribacter cellanae]QTE24142.1 Ig-like domain-containing protein [Polaribacter cellanae]
MKTKILLVLLLAFILPISKNYAQVTTLYSQDFEGSTDFDTYQLKNSVGTAVGFNVNGPDYITRANPGSLPLGNTVTGFTGKVIALEDHDGAGFSGDHSITTNAINITGASSLTFKFRLAAPRGNNGGRYDSNDFLRVQTSINGAAFQTIINTGGANSDGKYYYDASNNGITGGGDDIVVSQVSQEITSSISGTGSSMIVRVLFNSQGSQGELLFDDLLVTGVVAANNAPTNITLSPSSINQTATGTNVTVGTLSTTDADAADSHTYSLVSGSGSTNNGSFNISGSTLRTSSALNAGTYSIRVNTNDGTDNFAKAISIIVLDNIAPNFNSANSTPNDNATNVATANNIVIDFNENIALGTGFITLRDVTGASNVETFNVATQNDGATTSPTSGRIGIVNDKIYINPTNNLTELNMYAIQIAATAIDDTSGNSFSGISDETTFNFTTADETNPSFNSADSTPNDNATNVATANNIVIDFNENIALGTGFITLRDVTGASNVETFNVATQNDGATTSPTSGRIGIVNDKIYINPTNNLTELNMYAIQIAATAIDDTSGNSFSGISDETTFNFTTADETNPSFNSADSTPNDNATNVATANNIVIDFNENIALGTGFITLRDVTGASNVETFNVATQNDGATTSPTSGRIGIVNDKIYINPTNNLTELNMYAIQIAATAIDDTSGNSFSGISDETTFNFTTADETNPSFNSADSTPNDNATNVATANNIVIDFNENIALGTGFITLRNVTSASDVETFNVATENDGATTSPTPGRIGIVNDKIYINPINNLINSNAYAIQIAATAVDDTSGNSFPGISDETTFNFTTVAITWLGTTTDWNTASNWNSNSTPIATDDIIIPNVTIQPIITSGTTAVANNITIDASSSLTIAAGGSLTIEGNLTQNGTFTINSNATSNGSLIVKGTHSGIGTVDYKRYVSTSGDALKGWHTISSPVNGKNIDDFYGSLVTNGTKRGIAPYVNTNAATFKWDYYTTADVPGFFTEGKGYTAKKSTAGTLTFNGFLNTNNTGVSIEVKATGDQFNAIGNPYTSYINSGTFLDNITAGRLTEKTIWLWDPEANSGVGDYITTNSTTAYKIAPGQGFFVKALATGNVTFSEALQTHLGGGSFLKQEAKPQIKLSLTDGTNIKHTDIFYIDNKTTGFDDGYDSSMFNGVSNPFAIYTQLVSKNQGKNLAIQTLPNVNYENMIIPIGINASAGKQITFSLQTNSFPADLKIFLEDKVSNTFTRLDKVDSSYTINIKKSLNGIGRFYIHTTSSVLSVDKEVALENISIYKIDNSTIRIAGLQQEKASVKLYNLLGKKVFNTSFDSNGVKEFPIPELAIGVYIVELTTNNGKLNKKIIIE